MLGTLFYGALDGLRIPQAARRLRRGATILCYHNVVADTVAGESAAAALHIPVAHFEAQICWLARHYEIVPLREVVERLEWGGRLGNVAALTFDDGYAGTFNHAVPILTALGVPATIFVVASAPGQWGAFWWDRSVAPPPAASARPPAAPAVSPDLRPADWPVIAAAARAGIDIGAHSCTHACLTQVTDAELERQLVGSREVIQREAGVRPAWFSYPYGLWNLRVKAVVRAAGYRAAFTIDPGLNSAGADPWALHRIPVPANISPAAFHAYAAGLNPRWALT